MKKCPQVGIKNKKQKYKAELGENDSNNIYKTLDLNAIKTTMDMGPILFSDLLFCSVVEDVCFNARMEG